jgi:hypothetical protein
VLNNALREQSQDTKHYVKESSQVFVKTKKVTVLDAPKYSALIMSWQ